MQHAFYIFIIIRNQSYFFSFSVIIVKTEMRSYLGADMLAAPTHGLHSDQYYFNCTYEDKYTVRKRYTYLHKFYL